MRLFIRLALLGCVLALAAFGRAEDIGKTIARQYGLDADMATNMRVEMIGERLGLAADLPGLNFTVFNDRELNAMALPDGRIFVTSLMAHSVTDDELAFVLGHEITHIKEKHANSQTKRATGGAILGAILAAALGADEQTIRMGADIAGGLTMGHYSRKDEQRADEGGIRLMTRLGYDPRKAADAMQRLLDKYGRGDAKTPVLGWFATHPDTASRKQRLLETAAKLEKNPLKKIDDPLGVTLHLDRSAEHARPWVNNYFSIALLAESGGRAMLMPVMSPIPVIPTIADVKKTPATATSSAVKTEQSGDAKKEKDAEKAKEEPLPDVTITAPPLPIAYRLTLSLRPTPVGNATTIGKADGTAVEAGLSWHNLATGMTGTLTTTAQTSDIVPWMAHQAIKDAAALHRLSDGKQGNVEDRLEAGVIRRVLRAFAEVVKVGGPVDHSAPVTIRWTGEGRPGDYIGVQRGNALIAEIRIESNDKKTVNGTVLWGVHKWQAKDQFFLMR